MRSRNSILKIIILGDSGVGKTSLLHQYVSHKFEARYKATIGADFMTKEVEVDGVKVTLQLWDTAGQERFQSLGSAFFRGADACVLVYDVTQAESFSHVKSWLEEFSIQSGRRDCALVGNKTDQEERRQVQFKAAEAWCAQQGQENDTTVPYFETSAKENVGVEEAFLAVVKMALQKKSTEEQNVVLPQTVNLQEPPANSRENEGSTTTCAC